MSPVFRRDSEVCVLMINARGIMISVGAKGSGTFAPQFIFKYIGL